jgi:hypothetical protein
MYDGAMLLVALALAAGLVVFLALRGRGGAKESEDANASAALDALVADAIERELAQVVFGTKASSDEERSSLKKALRGTDADIDVVTRLERLVKGVEVELIRYAHESDVEANVTVAYEDGRTARSTRRMAMTDVPRAARDSFEKKAITRVFVTWQLPWRR